MSGSFSGGLMFACKFTMFSESRLWECRVLPFSESRLWECRVFTLFPYRQVRFDCIFTGFADNRLFVCIFTWFSDNEVTFECIFTRFAENCLCECRVLWFKNARLSQKSCVFPFTFASSLRGFHVLYVILHYLCDFLLMRC